MAERVRVLSTDYRANRGMAMGHADTPQIAYGWVCQRKMIFNEKGEHFPAIDGFGFLDIIHFQGITLRSNDNKFTISSQ